MTHRERANGKRRRQHTPVLSRTSSHPVTLLDISCGGEEQWCTNGMVLSQQLLSPSYSTLGKMCKLFESDDLGSAGENFELRET